MHCTCRMSRQLFARQTACRWARQPVQRKQCNPDAFLQELLRFKLHAHCYWHGRGKGMVPAISVSAVSAAAALQIMCIVQACRLFILKHVLPA